jgi:ferredoxin-NADP reductase
VARAAVFRRLTWQVATVTSVREETPRVRTLGFEVSDWPEHRAGQHVDIRLTAADGYRAERPYSLAAAPGEGLAVTVERLEDGEVSPYLTDVVREGDSFEIRGPVGGYFVWQGDDPGPVLLAAGGSGVVPLRAMLRHRRRTGSRTPVKLLYSARSLDDVIYRDELDDLRTDAEIVLTLTRERSPKWTGHSRRVDRELLDDVAWTPDANPLAFVCGPTGFVEAVAAGLVELGYDPARVRTERFGGPK